MDAKQKGFDLPPAPPSQNAPVKAWMQPVTIPTYEPAPPDPNPMFLEKRVYQGSSGRVYPLPFTDRVATEKRDRAWKAAHIENEYLRVMVLPEIGGRLHVGIDKTNGYDFFYRQNVIKPALVGLAGPWISGGVEFNWPQHHRPATFLPVSSHIERHADGSQTVWSSDHDPMNRLKGMHGVCLHPGKAFVELKVRLYNRTPFVQTFLWWANAAAHVHERYQSFFPPDVRYVADHAGRAISSFPLADGVYYGVDYAARARQGVPEEERPRCFPPPGTYAPNDLSWYANIPVPTSYMALGSQGDFVGGYDHARQAGLVHVANHHISPGKKQWTWGNQEFGYAWDRNLTDQDGPYIELMAGVYTDNQPDFSFLAPYETRTFSQYWYPIQKIGPAHAANVDAAVSLQVRDGQARVGVNVTSAHPGAVVRLDPVARWEVDLAPGSPFVMEIACAAEKPTLIVEAGGRELIRYVAREPAGEAAPQPCTEPPLPADIAGNDELYITGLHLEQYRHATRFPEDYWREALRRDPGDSRCNNALGRRHLERGEFDQAERHFRRAIARLTRRNPNPCDGEPYYNLGLTLRYLGRDEEAYAAFYKATWNWGWRAAAYYAVAELDAKRSQWSKAEEHIHLALRVNSDLLQARNLMATILLRQGRTAEAARWVAETLALDPLDAWANWLRDQTVPGDNQTRLDVAFDLERAGLSAEAAEVLAGADFAARDGSVPMLQYALGRAADASPDYCFPSRLEEFLLLQRAVSLHPDAARAHYYLGNWLYDRRRHGEAIDHWERAVEFEPSLAVAWRNLGIGYCNVLEDAARARAAFERAFAANPSDARIFYERDQLWKRLGVLPAERLAEIEKHRLLVEGRDDLSVELLALYNQTRQPAKARQVLAGRKFQPWEGGEGLALAQHVRAHLLLGLYEEALRCPENLGEARHPLDHPTEIYYGLGQFARAAQGHGLYRALALRQLGRAEEAEQYLRGLLEQAREQASRQIRIDYFTTSLPTMLLFHDDLQKRNLVEARFLEAQARYGLGETAAALRLLDEVLAMDPNHAGAMDLRFQ
jgi:tetratricopeptide (TPR) repeat protein